MKTSMGVTTSLTLVLCTPVVLVPLSMVSTGRQMISLLHLRDEKRMGGRPPVLYAGQYPITTRIIANVTNPMSALMGIVRIQAHAMVRATPHFTALAPIVDPTPMIDE